MSSNKTARQKLEKEYGKGDMFKKANIEEKIEKKKTIKTYKKFLEERHYTGKFIKLYKKQTTVRTSGCFFILKQRKFAFALLNKSNFLCFILFFCFLLGFVLTFMWF